MVETATLPSQLSDEDVIKLILQAGEMTHVEVLYNRYCDKVYRKCISFVKEPSIAEDITHDIFMKVYFNLHSYKSKSKFSTWLYSITYNFCIDYLRKGKKQKFVSLENEDRVVNNLEFEEVEDVPFIAPDRLNKIMEMVTPEEKAILLMKYQDGMSIKEIKSIFSISESATKMRIKRAKEKVRNLYYQLYKEEK